MMLTPAQPRGRSRLPLTVVGLLASLAIAGPGAAADLPFPSPQHLGDWWTAAGPAVALMTALRLVMLVVTAALLSLVILHALADTWAWSRAAALALTPRMALPLLAAVGVLATACTTPSDAGWVPLDDSSPRATAVLRPIPETTTSTSSTTPTRTVPTVDSTTTSLVPLEGTDSADPGDPVSLDASDTEPALLDEPAVLDAMPTQWVVKAGEHLWSIAQWSLEDAWGRPPSDGEIEPYWRDVVQVNRSQLADPNNPDLILPGQELTMPPVPDAPATPPRSWDGIDRRHHLR